MNDNAIKHQLAEITTELYQAGIITATGGNISIRSVEHINALWITPSAIFKGALSPDDLVLIDLDGKVLAGRYPPSIEYGFHAGVMRVRPEVNALVHSHPPYAIVWGLGDLPIPPVTYDALLVGRLPFIPWNMVGSIELARAVIDVVGLKKASGAFLRNHGLITVGKNLRHAADLSLMVEHTLKVIHLVRQIGLEPAELDRASIDRLINFTTGRDL
jgi:ribulose-5-phosphate 4-epimerase/fuculose-1-phosphate aldolase